jgi:L,D-transpeptidase ErfK/SrfK
MGDFSQQTVITFPVGLGREEWPTPQVKFRVRGKTENPTWVIPESIKKERIEEKGWTENFIPGGHPDNPLGAYRIELTLPISGSYAIHGTNNPWAVGRLVTHGCVRLYPEDIRKFFPMVSPGVKGEFIYEPVKAGVHNHKVYVEVHKDIYNLTSDLHYEAQRILQQTGLEPFVDNARLAIALEERSGVPVNVTKRGRWKAGLAQQRGKDGKGVLWE